MFEAVNVGLVVPFVAVLRDPQLVFQSPMAQPLLTALGIREAQGLLIAMGRPYWNLRRQKPVIYCSYTAGFSVLRRARFTRHFWCGRHGLDLSRPAGSVHRDVVRFIESPPRTGAENRTTRVLPNPLVCLRHPCPPPCRRGSRVPPATSWRGIGKPALTCATSAALQCFQRASKIRSGRAPG
jgi:hypothetical protein